jgi:hypothetical protein
MRSKSKGTFALAGWVAGAVAVLLLGLFWPAAFPGIINDSHYYGTGPGLALIILGTMVLASPGAVVGGLIGSRLPREGGRTEQILAAGLMGIILAVPFGCLGLWLFSGY